MRTLILTKSSRVDSAAFLFRLDRFTFQTPQMSALSTSERNALRYFYPGSTARNGNLVFFAPGVRSLTGADAGELFPLDGVDLSRSASQVPARRARGLRAAVQDDTALEFRGDRRTLGPLARASRGSARASCAFIESRTASRASRTSRRARGASSYRHRATNRETDTSASASSEVRTKPTRARSGDPRTSSAPRSRTPSAPGSRNPPTPRRRGPTCRCTRTTLERLAASGPHDAAWVAVEMGRARHVSPLPTGRCTCWARKITALTRRC